MDGRNIKAFRLNKGLSLRAFGKQIGVSGEWVRQLESATDIDPVLIERICEAFNVEQDDPAFFSELQDTPQDAPLETPRKEAALFKNAKAEREKAERDALKPIRAEYIKRLRMKAGVTQMEIAEAMGITQSHFSAWECGRHFICDKSLDALEKAVIGLSKTKQSPKPETRQVSGEIKKARKAAEECAFITVYKAGILLSKGMMEKLGDSRHIVMYTDPSGGQKLIIKAAEPTEDGAKKLSFSSSWKIISVGYRSAAEKMLGFKVGDKAYRVNGTWTLDEQYEYWLFDMSTAVETPRRGRGRWERRTG